MTLKKKYAFQTKKIVKYPTDMKSVSGRVSKPSGNHFILSTPPAVRVGSLDVLKNEKRFFGKSRFVIFP